MSTTRRGQSSRSPHSDVFQIGDVAERVSLSLRTVRYYEESGLLMPVDRTVGGFRLYDNDAIDRLLLIKKMKPLGFTLDEMRALLTLRDELLQPGLDPARREDLHDRLKTWVVLAEEKLAALRTQVGVAETFVTGLHQDVEQSKDR